MLLPAANPPALTQQARDELVRRLEDNLSEITKTLRAAGFSLYEIGPVTMATRFAVSDLVKEHQKREQADADPSRRSGR